MKNNKITFLNEDNFKLFMAQYELAEDLDEIEDKFPDGTKIADYTIKDVVVIELKTLKDDPKEKMENYFHDVMKRSDFPAIYGEIDFRKVVSLLPDGEHIIRKFEQKAFRQIESIMSTANKQVISTIKNLDMNSHTTGALIIINEFASFFEPDVLINYISDMLSTKKSRNEFRFSNLHNVILIQETHKVKDLNQTGVMIPIYNVVNDNLIETETTKIASQALQKLIQNFSNFNNFKHKTYNNDDEVLCIEKIEQQPQSKKPLRGQELIEDMYRKNRYMKDFTDDKLIEFGSKVMSICYAMLLKEKPLIVEHNRKMQLFRKQIELVEESRLRPFDLRLLDIDPQKYAPK